MQNSKQTNQDKDKITRAMLSNWISHPISQEMLRIVKELHEDCRLNLVEGIRNQSLVDKNAIEQLISLKGQLYAYDRVLETKELLEELTEEHSEVQDES